MSQKKIYIYIFMTFFLQAGQCSEEKPDQKRESSYFRKGMNFGKDVFWKAWSAGKYTINVSVDWVQKVGMCKILKGLEMALRTAAHYELFRKARVEEANETEVSLEDSRKIIERAQMILDAEQPRQLSLDDCEKITHRALIMMAKNEDQTIEEIHRVPNDIFRSLSEPFYQTFKKAEGCEQLDLKKNHFLPKKEDVEGWVQRGCAEFFPPLFPKGLSPEKKKCVLNFLKNFSNDYQMGEEKQTPPYEELYQECKSSDFQESASLSDKILHSLFETFYRPFKDVEGCQNVNPKKHHLRRHGEVMMSSLEWIKRGCGESYPPLFPKGLPLQKRKCVLNFLKNWVADYPMREEEFSSYEALYQECKTPNTDSGLLDRDVIRDLTQSAAAGLILPNVAYEAHKVLKRNFSLWSLGEDLANSLDTLVDLGLAYSASNAPWWKSNLILISKFIKKYYEGDVSYNEIADILKVIRQTLPSVCS